MRPRKRPRRRSGRTHASCEAGTDWPGPARERVAMFKSTIADLAEARQTRARTLDVAVLRALPTHRPANRSWSRTSHIKTGVGTVVPRCSLPSAARAAGVLSTRGDGAMHQPVGCPRRCASSSAKYHCWPFFVGASRDPTFFVELGAPMMVTSTIGPFFIPRATHLPWQTTSPRVGASPTAARAFRDPTRHQRLMG